MDRFWINNYLSRRFRRSLERPSPQLQMVDVRNKLFFTYTWHNPISCWHYSTLAAKNSWRRVGKADRRWAKKEQPKQSTGTRETLGDLQHSVGRRHERTSRRVARRQPLQRAATYAALKWSMLTPAAHIAGTRLSVACPRRRRYPLHLPPETGRKSRRGDICIVRWFTKCKSSSLDVISFSLSISFSLRFFRSLEIRHFNSYKSRSTLINV